MNTAVRDGFVPRGLRSRVVIARRASQDGPLLARLVGPTPCLLLHPPGATAGHSRRMQDALYAAGIPCSRCEVPDGEPSKTLEGLSIILRILAEERLRQDSLVIALGGGTLTDKVGLAAGLFHRGIRLGLVPSTLLAMLDASIGGKTAVNLPAGKNLAGMIHQAEWVILDPDLLTTLPTEEMVNGQVEWLKLALLCGGRLLEQVLTTTADRNPVHARPAIDLLRAAIRTKARLIHGDLHDRSGKRALLNLGHTLGHAIEAADEGKIGHGRAVAIGLLFALWLSERRLHLNPVWRERVQHWYEKRGLPTRDFPLPATEELLARMDQDKKNRNTFRLVLLHAPGSASLENLTRQELQTALEMFRNLSAHKP